ncbi:MAG: polysulfide reductase, partial [Dehalococcoidia bacterium]|nr:polysulfide reductase [Dehalococcoidia bacterium]
GQPLSQYLTSLITPFNIVAAAIIAVGVPIAFLRYWQGLGAVTNLSDTSPWGLWIGFDVLVGVALAAGGYTLASAVYIFRLDEYRPLVRAAILTGLLGYFFAVIGILFDLGKPWRLPYPILFYFGVTSVMFLVAWHVLLYLTCQFVEFSPAVFEWLGWKTWRRVATRLTLGFTIFGVMLSTLHQSALGALFLLAPGKLHPLWYCSLIPILFFVSSIAAGLSMVIFEGMLSHRIFNGQISNDPKEKMKTLTLGLGKAAAVVLFVYFWLKVISVIHEGQWALLGTPMGQWFLVEVLGGVLLPCFLFLWGAQKGSVGLVRVASILTVLGIALNRFNVSIIAFNWNVPDRYLPRWTEIMVSITIITVFLLSFRWIVNRMPVLRKHPDYPDEH